MHNLVRSGLAPSELFSIFLIALLFLQINSAKAQIAPDAHPVYLEGGSTDCGDWLQARSEKRSAALEHFMLGFIDGMAIGYDQDFWNAGGKSISRNALYFSIDNYCHAHPTSNLIEAGLAIFKEKH